jgi:plastocyanin
MHSPSLRLSGLVLAAALICRPALAADIAVTVADKDGKPVANAVASFVPTGGAGSGAIKFPWAYSVAQRNIQFDPYVLIVPVGAEVSFPNEDKVRHHVYSFSPAKRFELKLYGREQKPALRFDKVGTVALGCNIHDSMIGYIRVVDTPYVAKTDAAGKAVLRDLPAGGGTLTLWQPDMRAADNQVSRKVTGAASEVFVVDLRKAR